MAQVTAPNKTISEQTTGSITVPTGETWKINLSASVNTDLSTPEHNSISIIEINNHTVYHTVGGDGPASNVKTVVTGGDTINYNNSGDENSNDNGAMFVSGFAVENEVENIPISYTLSSGESQTVPTGETWKVFVLVAPAVDFSTPETHRAGVKVNGNLVLQGSMSFEGVAGSGSSGYTEMVLTEGDTVECSSTSGVDQKTTEGVHIGGFKI